MIFSIVFSLYFFFLLLGAEWSPLWQHRAVPDRRKAKISASKRGKYPFRLVFCFLLDKSRLQGYA